MNGSQGRSSTGEHVDQHVELWRVTRVGFYYVDRSGGAWATWSGPAVPCMVCGRMIDHGYETPAAAGTPARAVCVDHVEAHNALHTREDVARIVEQEGMVSDTRARDSGSGGTGGNADDAGGRGGG